MSNAELLLLVTLQAILLKRECYKTDSVSVFKFTNKNNVYGEHLVVYLRL